MNAVATTEAPAAAAVAQLPRSAEETTYSLLVRKARALASSTLVPESYRGEANLGNVFIALDVAERIGASPTAVMQSLHVIHGRPSWSASFLIGTVNACGRFSPMRFETAGGDDPSHKDYRVRAHAKDRESGEICEGPWITWKMVEAEGWSKKSGSKWLSMPALMFMYRAAAFWTRVYAPELSLGIQTAEEVHDVHEARLVPERQGLSDLQESLRLRAAAIEHQPEPVEVAVPAVDTSTGEIIETAEAVGAAMKDAINRDQLDEAADRISMVPKADRAALVALYDVELARVTAA